MIKRSVIAGALALALLSGNGIAAGTASTPVQPVT